jgi:hypothetical protein
MARVDDLIDTIRAHPDLPEQVAGAFPSVVAYHARALRDILVQHAPAAWRTALLRELLLEHLRARDRGDSTVDIQDWLDHLLPEATGG